VSVRRCCGFRCLLAPIMFSILGQGRIDALLALDFWLITVRCKFPGTFGLAR
jgi:hypothetical protein